MNTTFSTRADDGEMNALGSRSVSREPTPPVGHLGVKTTSESVCAFAFNRRTRTGGWKDKALEPLICFPPLGE